MKTPLEWINQVGEAAGQDMFCGDPHKPGSRVENVIKEIQSDAQSDLMQRISLLEEKFRHTHVGPYDNCAMCRLDLRDPIHKRVDTTNR